MQKTRINDNCIWALVFLFSTLILHGCSTPHEGVYHTVGRGETLWRIARTYNVSLEKIIEKNNIRDPAFLQIGQKIFIPGAEEVRKVAPYTPGTDKKKSYNKGDKIFRSNIRFVWPVKGRIVVGYGIKEGQRQNGIEIDAPRGTPIRAAGEGKVIYSENNIKGYGSIIIIKHPDNFYTTYAYNEKNLVKAGEKVKKGEIIATVGFSRISKSYALHFEIRKGTRTQNPLFYLP